MCEISWDEIYKLAKKYYKLYGNLEVPYEYCIEYKDSTVCLGAWIKRQRELKKRNKLSNLQINLLEEISIEWYDQIKVKKAFGWNEHYELAKEYFKINGDLLIPYDYEIKKDNECIRLGIWINTQRQKYKENRIDRLNENQIKMLEQIGMIWDVNKYNWLKNYELAKKYYETYGNLLITQTYVVTSDNKKINLGAWIKKQRELKKRNKLSNLRINLLEEIGMVWEVNEYNMENANRKWLEKYELAKKYYEEHGDLLVPKSYIVEYKNKEVNLDTWLTTQRMRYNGKNPSKLSFKQIKLLEEIGMVWNLTRYKQVDKYLKKQYMLYEQNKLKEDDVIKLLEDGAFIYGDSNEILKADSYKFYGKIYYK